MNGHGEKRSRKQDQALAALLSEPTIEEAASKVGVNESTLRRWLAEPGFRSRFREAGRQLVEFTVARLEGTTAQAVNVLLDVAVSGKRDCDRVRAAIGLLANAFRAEEVLRDLRHAAEAEQQALSGAPMPVGISGCRNEILRLIAEAENELRLGALPLNVHNNGESTSNGRV